MKKEGFTLVELIVVITILAILGTIAFISLQGYTDNAKESKILYDVRNLTHMLEIKLSKGEYFDNLILNNRMDINGVNTGSTIFSGSYILGDLEYGVGVVDFKKLKLNKDEFIYDDRGIDRDYIFGYVQTPKKIYYQFAGESYQPSGKYKAIIKGNYVQSSSSDARGLVSESGSDIGLVNGQTLTGSLY